MPKIIYIFLISWAALFPTLSVNGQTLLSSQNSPINLGETLEFKLSYGWFSIGKATMKTSVQTFRREGMECYKVEINGTSSDFFGLFSKVDDTWGALIRKDSLNTVFAYRDLQEGNYLLDEKVYFDYKFKKIKVDIFDEESNQQKPTKYFDLKKGTLDLVGGFMSIRGMEFNKMSKGDTIKSTTFLAKYYETKIVFLGKEMLKSKFGKVLCYVISPILPKNSIFRGEQPIKMYISADANRLPIKTEADMFFGSASCTLSSYKNVKFGVR